MYFLNSYIKSWLIVWCIIINFDLYWFKVCEIIIYEGLMVVVIVRLYWFFIEKEFYKKKSVCLEKYLNLKSKKYKMFFF